MAHVKRFKGGDRYVEVWWQAEDGDTAAQVWLAISGGDPFAAFDCADNGARSVDIDQLSDGTLIVTMKDALNPPTRKYSHDQDARAWQDTL